MLYTVGAVTGGSLSIVPRPRGWDWLDDELMALRAAGIDVLLSLLWPAEAAELGLSGEAAAAQRAGLAFLSFPIPNGGVPLPEDAARVLVAQLREHLAAGRHVGVHCRQSVGRASLVAASILVAGGLLPEDAWRQVERARGCPVPDTAEQRAWVRRLMSGSAAISAWPEDGS